MTGNSLRIAVSVWLIAVSAVQAQEPSTLYTVQPITQRCPEPLRGETQTVYEGRVRQACDAEWKASARAQTSPRSYAEFMEACARACPATVPPATAQTPQLTQLGSQAAGAGSGSNTALEIAGGVGVIALLAGLAAGLSKSSSGPADHPASP